MLLSMGGESTPASLSVAVEPSDLPAVASLTDTLTPEAFLETIFAQFPETSSIGDLNAAVVYSHCATTKRIQKCFG